MSSLPGMHRKLDGEPLGRDVFRNRPAPGFTAILRIAAIHETPVGTRNHQQAAVMTSYYRRFTEPAAIFNPQPDVKTAREPGLAVVITD